PSNKLMGDPRNVAHAKKVSQEKHHKEKHAPPKAGPAPTRRKTVQTETKSATKSAAPQTEVPKPTQPVEPTQLEKSLVVLSKLNGHENEEPIHRSSDQRGPRIRRDRTSEGRKTRRTNYQRC